MYWSATPYLVRLCASVQVGLDAEAAYRWACGAVHNRCQICCARCKSCCHQLGWAHEAVLVFAQPIFRSCWRSQVAAVSCRFDQIRKHQPNLAKHRWQNIFWYGAKAAQTGWLCGGKPLTKHAIQIKVILRASSGHATPFLHLLEGCCGALVHIIQGHRQRHRA